MQGEIVINQNAMVQLGLVSLLKGEIAIFCGAGISINSGLPLANSLKKYILDILTDDSSDIDEIMASKLPFESFVEIIFQNYRPFSSLHLIGTKSLDININSLQDHFLDVFKNRNYMPNFNHLLMARLAKHGYLKTIVTTNFDCLIETACIHEKLQPEKNFRVIYDEEEFAKTLHDKFRGLTIYKIHGTAENLDSVRATLQQVANQNLSIQRQSVVEKLLLRGSHKKVLVMGYSCSDHFDISPAIRRIKKSKKVVLFIDHCTNNQSITKLGEIPDQDPKDIFKTYNGFWLRVNTDAFVKGFWDFQTAQLGLIPEVHKSLMDWREIIKNWENDLVSEANLFTRYWIISRSRKSRKRVTRNDISQIEQILNSLSQHACQAAQGQPKFGKRCGQIFQANCKALTVGNVEVE